MRLVLFFFLFSTFFLNAVFAHNSTNSNKNLQIVSLAFSDRSVLERLNKMDMDILGVDLINSSVDLLLEENKFDFIASLGEVIYAYPHSLLRTPDHKYKTPAQIEQILKDFHNRYRDITRLEIIGRSIEGRNIWAIVISDNPTIKEKDEPVILFNSMHHAREVMTPEVALDIIEQLLIGYQSDSKVTHWVDSNEIWIIPMLNVDGNNIVWTRDNMWRKNARDNHGVDLNRNYPHLWGSCNGSSANRGSQTYRGPAPASEPETIAIMNLVEKIRPVFNISYHAYSEMVIYPYGCRGSRADMRGIVENIGKKMGSLLNYSAGTAWELLYSADGGDIDWMHHAYQVIPFVIEVSSTREGFQPNYDRFRNVTVERNRVGWQYLLDRLDQSAIRLSLSDTVYGNIDVSKLKIELNHKIDQDLVFIQNYQFSRERVAHMVVNPGDYQVRVLNGMNQVVDEIDLKVADKRLDLLIE